MKKYLCFQLLVVLSTAALSQNPLSIFDNLLNKTWKAEGEWGNGQKFIQEITAKYTLDSTMIMVTSKGFTNQEQTQYGLRNYGIRQYDNNTKSINFWEFDVFGNVTQGKVTVKGKNIYYQYAYGDSQVTDMWEFVNDSTYNFKVGNYTEGIWKQTYLSTQFHAQPTHVLSSIYEHLKRHLKGNWTSKAWNGIVNENWSIDDDGNLKQTAQYIEDHTLRYEAANKMELIDNELILMTIIKNSNPKIFKATAYSENHIVFENSDYKNPNKVVYKFNNDNKQFEREISGTENNKPSKYTFKFEKIKD